MKKALIFIALNLFLLLNNAFAALQKVPLISKRDSSESPCVKINLSNGEIRYGRVLHLDEDLLTYQSCDKSSDNLLKINVIEIVSIVNSEDEILFQNPQNSVPSKYKGKLSIVISLIASTLAVTSFFLTLLFFPYMKELILSVTLYISPIIAFITGIAGWTQRKRQPEKSRIWKTMAWLSIWTSGMILLLTLLLRETLRF